MEVTCDMCGCVYDTTNLTNSLKTGSYGAYCPVCDHKAPEEAQPVRETEPAAE